MLPVSLEPLQLNFAMKTSSNRQRTDLSESKDIIDTSLSIRRCIKLKLKNVKTAFNITNDIDSDD
jgi:hypothetical protein